MDQTLPPQRRFLVIINRGSGTVRSLGVEAVKAMVEGTLKDKAEADVDFLDGSEVISRVERSLNEGRHEVIVVGGGDGTLSSVAGRLVGTAVALAVLPLGTMNMIARTLGIEGSLEQALATIAAGDIANVDVGRVNGRVFLHQVSFGMQPRVVKLREKIGYRSRVTKMLSGVAALLGVLSRPRPVRLIGMVDGQLVKLKLPALSVSNNIFRDDRPAIADRLDGGTLGVYMITARRWRDYLRLMLAALRGTWKDDDMVDARPAQTVRIETRRFAGQKILASIDGELTYLEAPVELVIDPGALRMVVPRAAAAEG